MGGLKLIVIVFFHYKDVSLIKSQVIGWLIHLY